MAFAERATHKLYYEVAGDPEAQPVLLVMGMGFSSRAWDTLPSRLLNLGMRVITFDNRGTGRSDRPPGFFRIRDMADDAAAVLDAAGIARAHVFGVSMGGMTSLELALRHRAKVDTLALGCTYATWRSSKKPAPSITRALLSSAVQKHGAALERVAPVLISDDTWRDNRDGFAQWMARVDRGPPKLVGLQMAAVLRHDTEERLARLDVAALVITGALDRLVPPENSRVLAGQIKNAQLVEVEGAGHCFPFEKPDEVSAALHDFWRARSASPSVSEHVAQSASQPTSSQATS